MPSGNILTYSEYRKVYILEKMDGKMERRIDPIFMFLVFLISILLPTINKSITHEVYTGTNRDGEKCKKGSNCEKGLICHADKCRKRPSKEKVKACTWKKLEDYLKKYVPISAEAGALTGVVGCIIFGIVFGAILLDPEISATDILACLGFYGFSLFLAGEIVGIIIGSFKCIFD